jgi:hypothetical protein
MPYLPVLYQATSATQVGGCHVFDHRAQVVGGKQQHIGRKIHQMRPLLGSEQVSWRCVAAGHFQKDVVG